MKVGLFLPICSYWALLSWKLSCQFIVQSHDIVMSLSISLQLALILAILCVFFTMLFYFRGFYIFLRSISHSDFFHYVDLFCCYIYQQFSYKSVMSCAFVVSSIPSQSTCSTPKTFCNETYKKNILIVNEKESLVSLSSLDVRFWGGSLTIWWSVDSLETCCFSWFLEKYFIVFFLFMVSVLLWVFCSLFS